MVGIAAVEAFRAKVPEGYRPEDILPGARSVVVAGGDGPTAEAWRSSDHRVREITRYDLRENVAVHAMSNVEALKTLGWQIAQDLPAVPARPAIVYPSHYRRAVLS